MTDQPVPRVQVTMTAEQADQLGAWVTAQVQAGRVVPPVALELLAALTEAAAAAELAAAPQPVPMA